MSSGSHPHTPARSSVTGEFVAMSRPEVETELFFHVAPASALDSITVHGLDHARGESAYADTSLEYPAGNYLFTDPDAATTYAQVREEEELDEYGSDAEAYDVYEVRLPAGAPIHVDPFAESDDTGLGEFAIFTTAPIPATHIRHSG